MNEINENDAVIVSAVRTPIGNFNGMFKNISVVQLGSLVIQAALSRANIDSVEVDEVIMGNVLQAGNGQNPARQAALAAGLSEEIPAMTINKVCGSGLKAVHLAWQSIRSGESELVVAGGMEKRLLEVREIAEYAVFLASDMVKGVTGQAVVIDGGLYRSMSHWLT